MNTSPRSLRPVSLIAAGLVLLAGAGSLRATDRVWNTADTGYWNDAANWGGTFPSPDDDVYLKNVFNSATSGPWDRPNYIILSDGVGNSRNLSLSSDYNSFVNLTIKSTLYGFGSSVSIGQRGSVTVDGGVWVAPNSNFSMGSGGGSNLQIINEGSVSNLSASIGGNGSATVTSGTWSMRNDITVSGSSSSLTVNGGQVSTNGSGIIGTGGVSGVGGGGDGTVNVSNGGALLFAGDFRLAGIYSEATVNVSSGRIEVGGVTYAGLDYNYSTVSINLSGTSSDRGTLSTTRVVVPTSGATGIGLGPKGSTTLTFNGGILQARADQSNFITGFAPGEVSIGSGGAFIDSNGHDIGINDALTGGGGFTKLGAGTLTLSASNSWSGNTAVKGGTLNVTGTINRPSADIKVGESSGDNGTLKITGGTVLNNYALLGYGTGSTGSAQISSGTWTNSGDLHVGYAGSGSLVVDGGSVSARSILLGTNSNSSGSITVNGGSLSASDTFYVGYSGPGTFEMTGGTVTSGISLIGTGSAKITGGTWNISDDLLIANGGIGSLEVSGGTVNVDGVVRTGIGSGQSTITLSNTSGTSGVLVTDQVMKAGGTGSLVFKGGTLRAGADQTDFLFLFTPGDVTIGSGGAVIDSNGHDIGINTTLSGAGGLTKQGTGTLSLGASNSYTGGTTITAGTLRMNNANALGSSPRSLAMNGGTLDTNGNNLTVTSLSSDSGAIINSGAVAGSGASLHVNQNTNTTFAGSLKNGTGNILYLDKRGTGTLTLTGNNTYTGETSINGGAVIVNGSIASSSLTTVDAHSTLGGSGTVGNVRMLDKSILSPGNSPGLLTIQGNLTMDADSILKLELAGTAPGLFDQLSVSGLFEAAGATLQLDLSYSAAVGDSFHIFTGSRPDASDFIIESNLSNGLTWDISQLATTGTIAVVPEPGTWAMVAFGMGAIGYRLRRRGLAPAFSDSRRSW